MSDLVHLVGAAWGAFRGRWTSACRLVSSGSGWALEESGRERDRWPDLASAAASLWPRRTRPDRLPWAIGWISYEEAAVVAGGLPVRAGPDPLPRGWWLLEPEPAGRDGSGAHGHAASVGATWQASLDDDQFRGGVAVIRERIAAGDVYQVSLTRRFSLEPWRGGLGPLLEAAGSNPLPAYLCHAGFDGGELVCASMELLLRRRGTWVETRPIKGTRPRGRTAGEDRALAEELAADAKERAELAMVVDLERNDLGQVAESGTVEVADPGSVHRYATIHHRVARVRARVAPELPWWQLLAAVAPGGSVTGCPKRAAMAVIAALEPVPRGVYTGALGVVAGNGDLELALPIRTAWRVGERLELAAGCGIVWGSDPEREELESRLKVARWLALGGPA